MKKSYGFKVSRILCPVDFGDLSNLALKYAAAGAKAYGARLTVFHAERFEMPAYFTPGQTEALSRQVQALRRGAEDALRQHAKTVLGPLANDIALSFEVTEAHPVDGVLAIAHKQGSDVIVLGTHGRGGAKRLWLGSVAENVVRQAEVPVFVVRQKQHEFVDAAHPEAALELKTILCPVNFSESARRALRVATAVAERFQARLVPLCVVEPSEERTLPDVEAKLRSWVADTASASCPVEMIQGTGAAAREIVAHAQKTRADLVVLGAQRQASVGTWLLGGTTELVLRQAPTPVLVVPSEALGDDSAR